MLHQMTLHTEEDFHVQQLQASPRAPECFIEDCKHLVLCGALAGAHLQIYTGRLKKNPNVLNWPIKAHIDEMKRVSDDLKAVSDEEAIPIATLVERCLHLGPVHRSTATELLSDPWFDGVE